MPASRRLFVTLLGIVLAADGACSRKQRDSAAPETRVPLLVHNHSFFDVAIYALPAGATTRVRLGNVTGFSSATLSVSPVARRGGGSLVLQLHAIGSNQQWVTPEIFLYEGVVACLDIYSDLSGDLSRSSFYTAVAPDSEPPRAGRRDACGPVVHRSDADQGPWGRVPDRH